MALPPAAADIGLDPEIVISALIGAHEIRPERYTILDSGLNRMAACKGS